MIVRLSLCKRLGAQELSGYFEARGIPPSLLISSAPAKGKQLLRTEDVQVLKGAAGIEH